MELRAKRTSEGTGFLVPGPRRKLGGRLPRATLLVWPLDDCPKGSSVSPSLHSWHRVKWTQRSEDRLGKKSFQNTFSGHFILIESYNMWFSCN